MTHLEEALAAFDRTSSLDSGSVAAHNNRGLVLHDMGRHGAALEALSAASRLDPGNGEVLSNRGLVLQDMGRLDEALAAIDTALAVDPGLLPASAHRADILSELGRLDDAIAAFGQVLSREGGFAEAYCGRGIASLRQGDAAAALRDLEICLEHALGHVRAIAFMAPALARLGRSREATALCDLERFPLVRTLPPLVDGAERGSFRDDLRQALLDHPSLNWEPMGKTTRGGFQTSRLRPEDGPAIAKLLGALNDMVGQVLAGWPLEPEHPLFFRVPDTWRLSVWATVLRSGGHQQTHIHPEGWLSGVCYVAVPDAVTESGDGHEGWLELGRPGYGVGAGPRAPIRHIHPRPGRLVLFPSSCFHRTLPFDSDQPRISIAFDVEPLSFPTVHPLVPPASSA